MGNEPALLLEHLGADAGVERLFRRARRRGEQQPAGNKRQRERAGARAPLSARGADQEPARENAEHAHPIGDRARADRRDEEERRAQRADDAAGGGDAVDHARDGAGFELRVQQQPDGEGREHAEQGHGEEHDGEGGGETAERDVVDAPDEEFQRRIGEGRQQHQIGGPGRQR